MTALTYFVVAVFAAVLATRAFLDNRLRMANQALLGLGWSLAIAYASFGLSLLPGLRLARLVTFSGLLLVPAFATWTLDQLYGRPHGRPSTWVPRLGALTAVVAPGLLGLQIALFRDEPGLTPPMLVGALLGYAALSVALVRLWEVHQSTPLKVDQLRLRYLIGLLTGAVVASGLEQLVRALGAPVDVAALSLPARAVALQGPVPPIGALLAGVALYVLYHTVVSYRLLDLFELVSRLAALVVTAAALVLIDGLAVVWVDTFAGYPFHTTFQLFLASVLFLAAYDPIREQIRWWINRLVNQRGQQLAEATDSLLSDLPTAVTKGALTRTLLTRLHASGRVPVCSVYLWNGQLDAYTRVGLRGEVEPEPLTAVAAQPFTTGFADGRPFYGRRELARIAPAPPSLEQVLDLMVALSADLVVPIRRGELILGWICLQDEEWSDGFSAEEIGRLQQVASAAAVVLANIEEFQAMEEAHRLAALGAMAAGLAHEIRNPLAGVKGAAQYLQSEVALEDTAQQMLDVVITEADRLNVVVAQFLEYARPFELHRERDHLNALASHVLMLLNAQGLPDGVAVVEELAPELPALDLDRAKLSQVVLNLLQNAVQAMPDGGRLTLSTRRRTTREGDDVVELVVADTGSGIEPETMEQLFVPFFTTKQAGTGLGLAISQRIVQAHGGDIDVQSVPGRGATFVVRLPVPALTAEDEGPSGAKAAK